MNADVTRPERVEPPGDLPGASIVRAWTYVALWAAVVLLASNQEFSAAQTGTWLYWIATLLFGNVPSSELDMVHAMLRKTAHFVEYAILGLLAHRAFLLTWPRQRYAALLLGTLLVAFACASVDEGHQFFLPQRTGSFWDVLLDLCGASFGVLAYRLRGHLGLDRWDRASLALRGSVS
jgi:VanZ family protein